MRLDGSSGPLGEGEAGCYNLAVRLSREGLVELVDNLDHELRGKTFLTPVELNGSAFLIPVDGSDKKLIIALNPQDPLVFIYEPRVFLSTLQSIFLTKLRRELTGALIREVSLAEKDAVIFIRFLNREMNAERILAAEIIPHLSNLVMLDDEKKVIFAWRPDKKRDFMRGNPYLLPLGEAKEGGIRLSEEDLKRRFAEELARRRIDKYHGARLFASNKLKAAARKKANVEGDVGRAERNVLLAKDADAILTYAGDKKAHLDKLVVGERTYLLDPAKSVIGNVEALYKKARRARTTIEKAKENIAAAEKEEREYAAMLSLIERGSEKEIDAYLAEIGYPRPRPQKKATPHNLPYSVNFYGTIILFGRNAVQNDYLSFVHKTDREFLWLHVKDGTGPHVLLKKRSPTEDELLTAAEIAVIGAHKSAGDVILARKKNVRRGHRVGEALVHNQSVIRIAHVRSETISLYKSAKRFAPR